MYILNNIFYRSGRIRQRLLLYNYDQELSSTLTLQMKPQLERVLKPGNKPSTARRC